MPQETSGSDPELRKLQIELIRDERARQGLTQEQLAALAGVSRSLVAHVEAGTRNLTDEVIKALAKALQIKEARLRNPQAKFWKAA